MFGAGGRSGSGPTGEPPSDAALVRAHAAGDPHAFSELVRRHRDRMWAVALRTTRDPEEAADALQEALLSAHRGAAGFRADAAVSTWLHRIVVNACLDRMRRSRARPTVALPEEGLDELVSPGDAMAATELSLLVHEALGRIPADQRTAVVLVDIEGYSVTDAAHALGVAEGTVKSRCARGRTKLAVLLGHLRAEQATPNLPAEGNRSGPPRVSPMSNRNRREGR